MSGELALHHHFSGGLRNGFVALSWVLRKIALMLWSLAKFGYGDDRAVVVAKEDSRGSVVNPRGLTLVAATTERESD